jgi:hypothetical protein
MIFKSVRICFRRTMLDGNEFPGNGLKFAIAFGFRKIKMPSIFHKILYSIFYVLRKYNGIVNQYRTIGTIVETLGIFVRLFFSLRL